MGINIFSYGMHALNKKLVKNAVNIDKNKVIKELRRYPFKSKKGFRRIDNLPNNLLIEETINIAKNNPDLSNMLLKLWYDSETVLREKVVEELTKLGYKINPLLFDEDGINWCSLNENDLLFDEDKTYFAPNKEFIENFNPTETTLMCILNGWFNNESLGKVNLPELFNKKLIDEKPHLPTLKNLNNPNKISQEFQYGKENIDDKDCIKDNINTEYNAKKVSTNEETNIENFKNELSVEGTDNLEVNIGGIDTEIKDDSNKIILNKEKTTFSEKFLSLEKLKLDYEESKKLFLEILDNISKKTINDEYSNELNVISKPYKELPQKKLELINERHTLFKSLLEFIENINSKYNLDLEIVKYEKDEIEIIELKDILTKTKTTLHTVLLTNKLKLNDINNNLTPEENEIINEKLTKIENSISDFYIDFFDSILENIEEVLHLIEEINIKNDISNLSNEYLNEKKDFLFFKIQNFIYNNSENADKFAFFYCSSKDIDTCEFIDLYIDNIIDDLINSVDFLANKYSEEFYVSLIEDVDLISHFLKCEKGRNYLILISILLSIKNIGESTVSYLWDLKDDFNEYETIKKIVNNILLKNPRLYTRFNFSNLNNKIEDLQNYFFKESGRYKLLSTTKHKLLKDLLNNEIFPELEILYTTIIDLKNSHQLNQLKDNVYDEDFSIGIYNDCSKGKDINSHNEEFIRTNCLKEINKIKYELTVLIELKIEEINSKDIPALIDIENDLKVISKLNPELSLISNRIIKLLNNSTSFTELGKINLNNVVEETILQSSFFALNFSNICYELVNKRLENSQLLNIMLKGADNSKDFNEVIELLIKNSNYTNSMAIKKAYNATDIIIDPTNDNVFIEMIDLENRLNENKHEINSEYFYFKDKQRFGLAYSIILEDEKNQKELEKLSSKETQDILNGFKSNSLDLKYHFHNNKDNFQKDTYLTINNGLTLCEKVSDEMIENKIDITREILKEIEYLKINNDSNEKLKSLIEKFEEPHDNINPKKDYLSLPLNSIKEYLESENFNLLGLTKRIWNEIKDTRIQDILTLIDKWNTLKNKPITYDDSYKYENVRDSLYDFSKSLGRICNLYITNTDNKIGCEPFDEWRINRELPFVYATKIKNPNSEPLNQIIRIYFITESHLGSKSYINKIRDHINENNYNLNSFSVILLIGSRKKFNNLNTNPTTRDLPILDEQALKKIIFASETKKLPKWEFTNLLILTKKISNIQPFKSEGSVNSEVNIFVGRENIIKEITSVPKSFAFFGGRKIGKSSLLWEIKKQLDLKGFKTLICAFQGYSNATSSASMSAAKSILLELKQLFGKADLTNFSDLNEFKMQMKMLYSSNINQRVAIFLDEVDELIVREQYLKEHKLIEIFRDIAHETNHCWIFIFAGFKKMYLEIKGKGTTYEGLRNPWANFVDSSHNNLIGIDYPESLVNHGLKDILGLEYDSDISKLIVNYSSGHPAFLQYFCQCLVEQIKDKIDHNNRRIYIEDVKAVFEKKDDFISFVQRTLEMNLSDFQRLLIFIAAEGNFTEFDYNSIESRLKDWLEITEQEQNIDQNMVKLELELLVITGVIKKSGSFKYKFTHEYYLNILKRIEQIDRNVIENLVIKVFSEKENENENTIQL